MKENVWTNTANSFLVSLPEKLTDLSRISATRNGYTLRFALLTDSELPEEKPAEIEESNEEPSDAVIPEEEPDAAVAVEPVPAAEPAPEETEPAAEPDPTESAGSIPEETAFAEGSAPEEEISAEDPASEAPEAAEEPEFAVDGTAPIDDPTLAENAEPAGETMLSENTDPAEEIVTSDEENPEEEIIPDESAAEEEEFIVEPVPKEQPEPAPEPAPEEEPETPAEIFPAEDAAPEPRFLSEAKVSETESCAQTELERAVEVHVSSSVSYPAVLPGVDLRYDLSGQSLKENIILNSAETAPEVLRFVLSAPGLTLTEDDEDGIVFKAGDDVIFYFPAPFMFDADDAIGSVKTELQAREDGQYILTYYPDTEWLFSTDCVWPVTVDPVTRVETNREKVQDTYIRAHYPTTDWNGSYYCYCGHGAGSTNEYCSLVKHTTLPTLPAGTVVTGAGALLRGCISHGTGAMQVNVHPITNSWRIDYVFWNNKPACDTRIEDFQIIDGGTMQVYEWDVTRTVQSWYDGTLSNNGLIFFAKENYGSSEHLVQFNAVDGGATQYWPRIYIYYTNTTGLESGWDYTSLSAGRAGTVYTNNYTGKETTARTDLSYGGNRMPVSITFTHNQNDKGDNIGYGLGWRCNYAQTMKPATDQNLVQSYYVWTDGDGTRHYFYNDSSNVWKDEDGQQYTLTIANNEYDLVDRDNNSLHFDSSGRLTSMTDGKVSTNSISITYVSGNKIQTVTDGAGRVYAFTYSGSNLSTVSYKGHGSDVLETVSYGYSGNRLTSVTWKDGKSATYTYNSDNTLSGAVDIEGNAGDRVTLSYANGRVSGMTCYSGSTAVTTATLSYGNHWTKVADDVGRWCTYQFNNFGNTVSVYNQDGQALYGRYSADTDSSKPKNQLVTSSRLQDTVVNLLSIDTTQSADWQQANIPVTPGKTYTISGLLQAQGALSLSAGSAVSASETEAAGKRVPATITVPDSVSALTVSGPAARELQLEKSGSFNRYNLLKNTDMSDASYWTGSGTETGDGIITDTDPQAFLNASCLKLIGSATVVKRYSQTVSDLGRANHFTFGCWVKPGGVSQTNTNYPAPDGGTAPKRRCGVLVELLGSDGSVLAEKYAEANPACPEWQFLSGSVQAAGCTQARFSYVYENNENSSCFDGAQLFAEQFAYTYQYDDQNRIQTVTDLDGNTTSYTYRGNSSDIQTISLPGGGVYSYTYTESGLLTGTSSATGILTSHTHDSYGNLTQTVISYNGNSGPVMQSNNTYTADGNLPASVTAGDRHTVTYSYDADRSLLNSTTDALGTVTGNTYDEMGRLVSTVSGTSSVNYAYTNDRLSTITHSGGTDTGYSFAYTTGGLTGSVSAGGRTLVQNAYNTGRWTLAAQNYGNGQSWSYTYDNSDLLISKTDGTNSFRYAYNGEGAIGRIEKYVGATLALSQRFYYDTGNRLTRVVERDGTGAVTHEYSYTYNGDQIATGMIGSASRSFTYDGFGRISGSSTNGVLTSSYGYRTVADSGTAYATTQIASLSNSYAGGSRNYSYTYDDNGNILSVSDGTNTTSYAYDAQGQLTRENNQAAGKTWVYAYDNGGNILCRTEYAYTTGEPGTPADTALYTYGDSSWGDLLTSYDGQSVTYDAIGNMTAFEGWSFTWQGGRQLAGMSRGSTDLSFAYDDSGYRTGKTVNESTHQYNYRGELLIADICGNDALYFRYDQNGEVLGFRRVVGSAQAEYTYVKDQQGDIVAVVDPNGSEAATYTYDAWGNILSVGGSDSSLAVRNPLRYRGYYYDSETGLYYLMSRYYDPEIGRFICADAYATIYNSSIGANMFAYCNNNPTCANDDDGNFANWLIGGVVGAAVGTIDALLNNGDFRSVAASAAQGAISGAIAGAGVDLAVAIVAVNTPCAVLAGVIAFGSGAIGNVAGEYTNAKINKDEYNSDGNAVKRALVAGCVNMLSFGVGILTKYAQTNSLPHPKTVKEAFHEAFKDSWNVTTVYGVKEVGYDVVSTYFAIHTSIIGCRAVAMVK